MRFALVIWGLLCFLLGCSTAVPIHYNPKRHGPTARSLEKGVPLHARDLAGLLAADQKLLSSLGVKMMGLNPIALNDQKVWIGSEGGTYKMNIRNKSKGSIIFVLWGAMSWVNDNQPIITYTIPAGDNLMISAVDGASGAFSAVYSDIILVDGQVSNTWGEFTFAGKDTTFDVTRLPNMNGKGLKMTGENCFTDLDTCAFHCTDGLIICKDKYILHNCEIGSQTSINNGIDDNGMPTGGCSGVASGDTIDVAWS